MGYLDSLDVHTVAKDCFQRECVFGVIKKHMSGMLDLTGTEFLN